uniref:Leukocyte receptor cluster member 8 n=2 Tax=Lygus hesperus TaxID=30085 RepID=A0A0A9XQ69_LYGHE
MQHPKTDENKLARRAARFKEPTVPCENPSKNNIDPRRDERSPNQSSYSDDEFNKQLIGTCELLEKCYLRLTSAPKESDVRPKHVLIKSLERVNEIWERTHDYRRASELLKAIRQDMTVQGIRDEFSIQVYEMHARLALQTLDHSEFNICQSVLKALYNEVSPTLTNEDEFTAYRLLYYLFTRDISDLTALMTELLLCRKNERSDSIQHSLDVALAWLLGCQHRIFKLYTSAPLHSSYVMNLFLPRERAAYFKILMKAYRPWVPITFITSELAFIDDIQTLKFLEELGNVVFTDSSRTKIDCKGTFESLK